MLIHFDATPGGWMVIFCKTVNFKCEILLTRIPVFLDEEVNMDGSSMPVYNIIDSSFIATINKARVLVFSAYFREIFLNSLNPFRMMAHSFVLLRIWDQISFEKCFLSERLLKSKHCPLFREIFTTEKFISGWSVWVTRLKFYSTKLAQKQ